MRKTSNKFCLVIDNDVARCYNIRKQNNISNIFGLRGVIWIIERLI